MIQPPPPPATRNRSMRWAPVTTRASGETLSLAIHTLEGDSPGPTLGLFSTSHGDEAFTVQVIREVLERIDPAALRGSIRAMPVGNPVAFESYTRSTGQGMNTDKTNLNRVFPGTPSGWLTEQMAHVISTEFLPGLDSLIDFHCGNSETAIDYILVEKDESEAGRASLELSKLCGTDLLYTAPTPEQYGTLSQYAKSLGIPTVIAQMGGNMPDPTAYIERCFVGVRNVLIHMGMLDADIVLPARQTMLSGARTLLAPHHGGLFVPEVGFDQLGKTLPRGTVLGRVYSAHTLEVLEVLEAVYDQTVLIMLRGVTSRVNPGDYAYILGNGATGEAIVNGGPVGAGSKSASAA
jgi:predicted deacylase